MEFFSGVLTGVFVSVVIQLVMAVHVKPILDLRAEIREIAVSLLHYSNVYGQAARVERKLEAQAAFRKHASTLRGKAAFLLCRWRLCSLGLIPNHANLINATLPLIGLSNWAVEGSLEAPKYALREEDITRTLLGIEKEAEEPVPDQ